MQGFLFAEFTEFLELQALFGSGVAFALAFFGLVIQIVADRALHVYQAVLGHRRLKDLMIERFKDYFGRQNNQ